MSSTETGEKDPFYPEVEEEEDPHLKLMELFGLYDPTEKKDVYYSETGEQITFYPVRSSPESEGIDFREGPAYGRLTVDYTEGHVVYRIILEENSLKESSIANAFRFLYFEKEDLKEEIEASKQAQRQLVEENARLKQQLYGASSEKQALSLSSTQDGISPVPELQEKPKQRPCAGGRKPLPPHLPREDAIHDLPPMERVCPCCQGELHRIGEDVNEELSVVPAKFKVIRHVRVKYLCRQCEKFVTAPGRKPFIEKSSYASPELLAHIACQKFQFALPFYRQEIQFRQVGLNLSRTTLANLMITSGDRLSCITERLREELLNQRVIHADETTVQVLNETGRKAQTSSYLWAYRSSENAENPVVLFDYQQTRAGNHARNFLNSHTEHPYEGFLHVDGYAGYNGLNPAKRVGCMAHVRRKFMDVIKNLPSEILNSPAHQAVALIGKLYEIEKRIKTADRRQRYKVRQTESKSLLDEFKHWLNNRKDKVLPKSPLGKAVSYALDQWAYITLRDRW